MPHVGWSTSLVADGVDLTRSDGRILLRVTRGINEMPEVRGKDTVVPSLSGRIPRNRKHDRLVIEAAGFVQGGTGSSESDLRNDLRSLIDAIRTLMNPVQDPYELVATVEDGTTRTITARPLNAVWGPDDIPSYRTLSLQWESVDASDWSLAGS